MLQLTHFQPYFFFAAVPTRKILYMYLANHVLQTARKKPEIIDAYAPIIEAAVAHVYKSVLDCICRAQ